jgi:hypothetical protein
MCYIYIAKRAIRTMTNSSNRISCRGLFKELGILPLCSQYILSLALFVAKNRENFIINSDIHLHNTRFNTNLHPSSVRLNKYQKGTYSSGIKIYNRLPTGIKQLSGDVNKFKLALKKFLLAGSFYSIEEFLNWSSDLNAMYLWLLNWLHSVPYSILFYFNLILSLFYLLVLSFTVISLIYYTVLYLVLIL